MTHFSGRESGTQLSNKQPGSRRWPGAEQPTDALSILKLPQLFPVAPQRVAMSSDGAGVRGTQGGAVGASAGRPSFREFRL